MQDVLGILDRSEDRGFAGIGAIDPYAQIDLVGAIVGVVELDQREERIGRLGFEVLKHGAPHAPKKGGAATGFGWGEIRRDPGLPIGVLMFDPKGWPFCSER